MSRTVVLLNGVAQNVPGSELAVLVVLSTLGQAHGAAICRASGGAVEVTAVYQLLARLAKRGLVERHQGLIEAGDIALRRVMYRLCEGVEVERS